MLCTHPHGRPQPRLAHCASHDQLSQADGVLTPGERVLTNAVAVHGWRYEPAEVTYERKTLMLGGPILFLVTGLLSAVRNRRARKSAEIEASPQWRPLGLLTVRATTDRLLVWHRNAWWSVWYSAITRANRDGEHLQLEFFDSAPYRLVGEVAEVAGVIAVSRARIDV